MEKEFRPRGGELVFREGRVEGWLEDSKGRVLVDLIPLPGAFGEEQWKGEDLVPVDAPEILKDIAKVQSRVTALAIHLSKELEGKKFVVTKTNSEDLLEERFIVGFLVEWSKGRVRVLDEAYQWWTLYMQGEVVEDETGGMGESPIPASADQLGSTEEEGG